MADNTCIESRLIELIQSYECLWDFNSSFYRRKDKRAQAWREISESLGVDSKELTKKFHHLRTTFLRIKKNVDDSRRSGCGEHEVYKPTWEHWSSLSFLLNSYKKMISPLSSYDLNQTQQSTSGCISDEAEETNIVDVHYDNEMFNESISLSPCTFDAQPPKKKKKMGGKEKENFYECAMNALCNEPRKDVFDEFGSIITTKLRTLPQKNALDFCIS
ncbi:transcription factor Adf-1-like [Centruroides sculpturatus]|uniref:transcription factor Adf-1-like n=1 Tax=Centruroides sculpturatus TaxID=218467 RepID=UPI000C6D10D7|nr:transcription factor Adf-1-like [Centruroides sculpturatus]